MYNSHLLPSAQHLLVEELNKDRVLKFTILYDESRIPKRRYKDARMLKQFLLRAATEDPIDISLKTTVKSLRKFNV